MYATILHMNQEETDESGRRDQRHSASQQDIKSIRVQVDKLSFIIGELTASIKGNDMGNPGMLPRQEQIERRLRAIEVRLDEMDIAAKKNQLYLAIAVGAICTVGGMILKGIIDYFSKNK